MLSFSTGSCAKAGDRTGARQIESTEKLAHMTSDKNGEALNAQRFQMLEDIARELSDEEIIFPNCFEVSLQLRKELQNPDLPIARIARIVSVEPLVVAKLIRLANSVFYNPNGLPVRNIPAAIARIGIKAVRLTALAIATKQTILSKKIVGFRDLSGALWNHSVKSAAAARILARTYTQLNPDEAMLAGLLHDIGAFYMLYRAAQYPELCERPDTVKHLIMQWHDSVGVSLLNALGLPEEIVQATVSHDHPRRTVPTGVKTFSDVVYVGNILSGAHFEWLYQEIDPGVMGTNALREIFSEILPDIESETAEMLAILD
jgi:putative nucleotidyltransferase with HDIG domain